MSDLESEYNFGFNTGIETLNLALNWAHEEAYTLLNDCFTPDELAIIVELTNKALKCDNEIHNALTSRHVEGEREANEIYSADEIYEISVRTLFEELQNCELTCMKYFQRMRDFTE